MNANALSFITQDCPSATPSPTNGKASADGLTSNVVQKQTSFLNDSPNASDTALDVEFGDLRLMSRPDALPLIRPEKGKAVRIAIYPAKAKMASTHYIDGTGTYRCLSTNRNGGTDNLMYCCNRLGDAALRIVALVVHYTNADPVSGKMPSDVQPQVQVGYVRLSRANYAAISKLPDEDSTVNDIDIVMTHADRAFGYEFHRISNAPRWHRAKDDVDAKMRQFVDGKILAKKLGKPAIEAEYRAVLSGETLAATVGNIDELPDEY